jgi:hypothetical protein
MLFSQVDLVFHMLFPIATVRDDEARAPILWVFA